MLTDILQATRNVLILCMDIPRVHCTTSMSYIYLVLFSSVLPVQSTYVDATNKNFHDILQGYKGIDALHLNVITNISLTLLIDIHLENEGLSLRGDGKFKITCSHDKVGFRFRGSGFLNVSGLTFENCGPSVAAVFVLYNTNATFDNCVFKNNFASGINAIDTHVNITNSTFDNNNAQKVATKFDDLFVFGKTNIGGAIGIMFHNGSNHYVLIENCLIQENSAFVKHSTFVNTHPTEEKKRILSNYFTLGGGISVLHAFNSSHNIVNITRCIVKKNTATYAGGIFITHVHNASYNQVYLSDLEIKENFVPQTGGGFISSAWDASHNNLFMMTDSLVIRNKAMAGGGAKLIQNNRHPDRTSFKAGNITNKIMRTIFKENIAKSASAIRLLFNQPIGFVAPVIPVFKDCNITDNYPENKSREYLAAIISSRLSFSLDGKVLIQSNIGGSAIYLSHAEIHVTGVVKFINNKGKFGGAIYVADVSRVILYPGSELHFNDNRADIRGGALFVESSNFVETMYPYNPGCFLQYYQAKTPPSKWEVKLYFINNSASEKGAAIYISTLLHCQWHENEAQGFQSYSKALRWNDDVFEYRGNYLEHAVSGRNKIWNHKQVDIATDTYEYHVQSVHNLQVAPGEPFYIKLSAADQLNHSVYSIPLVRSIGRIVRQNETKDDVLFVQNVVLTPDTTVTKLSLKMPNKAAYEELTSNTSKHHLIEISDTTSGFTATRYFVVETLKCRPGFYFQDGACICKEMEGVKRCTDGRFIHVKEGYWAGVVNGRFVMSVCPRNYCYCNKSKEMNVLDGSCLFDYQRPDNICVPGRHGVLCGQCDRGLSFGLQNSKCRNCDGTGWVFFFSIIIIIAMTCAVIYFNVNIPPVLRSVLFYVQVVPYIFTQHDQVGDMINFITGIVDIGRLSEFPLGDCALPGLGSLESVALSYVTPLTVIMVLLVVFMVKRRINWTSNHPFQRFFVLFVFIYKYLTETSFLILHCVDLEGKQVFYYDGNVECKSGLHFVLYIIAYIIIAAFVVLPLILVPLIVSGKLIAVFNYNCYAVGVADSLTAGYTRKNITPTSCTCACIDTGWWWSYDLSRRTVLVAMFVFMENMKERQIMFSFTCLTFLTIHSVTRPYEDQKANTTEAWFLFALTALTIIQTMESVSLRHTLTIFILVVTYGYGLYLLFGKIYHYFWRLRHPKRKQSQTQPMELPIRPAENAIGQDNLAAQDE